MRALPATLSLAGLALLAALRPWEAASPAPSPQPLPASAPGVAAYEPPGPDAAPGPPSRPEAQLRADAGDRSTGVRLAAGDRRTAADATPPAPPARAARPMPGAAAHRPLPGLAPRLRTVAPGSREHAEAIASSLASQEAQATLAAVARLYHAYFARAPDYEGFEYYVAERDAGAALPAIADEFAGSEEFEARYGTLDAAAFVDRMAANVGATLGASERSHWIAQLEAGRLTRGDVAVALSENAAFRARTRDEVLVTLAYADTLRREATPAERAFWVRELSGGRTPAAMIQALVAGPGGR